MDYERLKRDLEQKQLLMHTDVYDMEGRYIITDYYTIPSCGLPFIPDYKREILSVAEGVASVDLAYKLHGVSKRTSLIEDIICNGERQ